MKLFTFAKQSRKMAIIFLMSFLIGTVGHTYTSYASETVSNDDMQTMYMLRAKPFLDAINSDYYKPVNTSAMFEEAIKEVKQDTSFDQFMKILVSKLNDKYSEYFTEDEIKNFSAAMSGKFFGIGVEVSKDNNTGGIIVKRVFEKSPAEAAGLRIDDIIIKVNGRDISTLGLTDATALMKGEKGTEVEITVLRNYNEIKYTVVRDEIALDSVKSDFNEKTKIGYLSVNSFLDNTDEAFDEKLSELEKKGMKGLIIDLRNNGGGLVDSSFNMANRILKAGKKVFGYEYKSGTRTDFIAEDKSGEPDKIVNLPIYVLINRYSASASELFTGALVDNKAAKTVGEKSFGKGVAQSIFTASDIFGNITGALKITTFYYYLPNGESINEIGITPQYKVKNSLTEDGTLKEDKQLKKAEKLLLKDIKNNSKKKKKK